MKIYNETAKKLVTPAEMQDGQIGVIRRWDVPEYIDRYGVFTSAVEDNIATNKIEILPPGTLLEI